MSPSKHLASLARLQTHLRTRSIPTAYTHRAPSRTATSSSAPSRTMSSSSAPTAAATATSPTAPSEPAPSATPQRDTPPQEKTPLPLPSPSADTTATQLAVDGAGVKLDHLGPLVVNKDGSLSRIANWETMADVERANTLRILGKRNQLRLGGLKGEEGEGEGK